MNGGRRLFYRRAPDVGCAGCHPEGRDDGHTWHEATLVAPAGSARDAFHHSFLSGYGAARLFLDVYTLGVPDRTSKDPRAVVAVPLGVGYPRQTPMLAGRLSADGPYGWHAESKSLSERVEAGFDLHRWSGVAGDIYGNYASSAPTGLSSFLRKGLVQPPVAKRPLTAEETKGKQIYDGATADCARCHGPDGEPKDRSATALTALPTMPGFEGEEDPKFKPPNLQFVAGSAPYMHDGRYDSLESLIEDNHDRMGKTSHLSETERNALIAYLRTL
ncbi:MAG: c-type cytochrome [Polyangiaceae bacterium]